MSTSPLTSHEDVSVALDMEDEQWPPANPQEETTLQREWRLEHERHAKLVSDEIDRSIELDRQERRRKDSEVKILLLGQAESGKSTILRNFQLQLTPAAFKAEAAAWRIVIHLNLVRSVMYILDILADPSAAAAASDGESDGGSPSSQELSLSPLAISPLAISPLSDGGLDLRRLRLSLSPLRGVEETLRRFLSADDQGGEPLAPAPSARDRAFEVSVRSGSKWKSLFHRMSGGAAAQARSQGEAMDNARRVIEACREDMVALWAHPAVRESLSEQRVALEYRSGFFLDEVDRIAAPGYEPTPDDVLKARIQTMGVEEHILQLETVKKGQQWAIYDVGGSRSQRVAWAPFFDDVNLLIFITPVSAFNQTLAEDRKVNRLWDSIFLWKTICSNKLLADVDFVLLLNKMDILEAKLASGVQFGTFVTSYKDKPNDVENVMSYLKGKFSIIYKQHSKRERSFHIHFTCATDAQATSIVLARIQEAIFKKAIEQADFL